LNRSIFIIFLTLSLLLPSQTTLAERPRIYAITDVKIVTAPGKVIDKGVVVLRDGLIDAVGSNIKIPADAEIIAAEEGWTVYPAFIDAASAVGLEADANGKPPGGRGEKKSSPGSPHELKAVHPELAVISRIDTGHGSVKKHREIGFAVTQVLPKKGVFRGQSAIIALRSGPANKLILNDRSAQVVALESSSFMARQYPSSKIGAMATIRQTLLDARRQSQWQDHYRSDPTMERPEFRSSDKALAEVLNKKTAVIFVSAAALDPGRFNGLASEFDIKAMTLARGLVDSADELKAAGMPILLPLEMPEKPTLDSPDAMEDASMESMQQYLLASRLPAALAKADVEFAFVTAGMKSARKFTENLAQAVEAGLSEQQALAAVTTTPAKLLGLSKVLGTIEAGKQANLLIVDGDLFVKKPVFKHLFVDGYHEEIKAEETKGDPNAVVDPRGKWEIATEVMGRSSESTWTISGNKDDWKGFSEGKRGKSEFSSVELVGNALTVIRSTQGGDMEITVIVTGEELSGETIMESPRGSATIKIEGRRISGPEGEQQ
jgi:hypothetical protein